MIDWTKPNLRDLVTVRHGGRWTPARKAALLRALARKEIATEEAIEIFGLSLEEIDSWRRLSMTDGARALRATKLQDYR